MERASDEGQDDEVWREDRRRERMRYGEGE